MTQIKHRPWIKEEYMPVKLNLPWSGSSFKLRDNNLHTSLYCPITVVIRRLLWTTWQSSSYEPLLYYHCRGQEAPLNYVSIIYIRASIVLSLSWSGGDFELRDNHLHTSLYCAISAAVRRLPLTYVHLHTSLYCTITVVVRRLLWTTWQSSTYEPLLYYHCRGQEAAWTAWQSSTYEPLLYYHCRGQEAPLNYVAIIYMQASIVLQLPWSGGSFELRDNHLHASLYCTITVVVRRLLWTTWQSS